MNFAALTCQIWKPPIADTVLPHMETLQIPLGNKGLWLPPDLPNMETLQIPLGNKGLWLPLRAGPRIWSGGRPLCTGGAAVRAGARSLKAMASTHAGAPCSPEPEAP